jgi:hypothetical protein
VSSERAKRTAVPRGRLSLLALAALGLTACGPAPDDTEGVLHNAETMPDLVGQRVVYCDDGSRADVDYLRDGLRMAVTWLPRARGTGDEFRNGSTRAVIAGGSIAFTRSDGKVRVCHRTKGEN